MKLFSLAILSRVDIDDMIGFLTGLSALKELGTSKVEIERSLWILTALEEFGLVNHGSAGFEITPMGRRFLDSSLSQRREILHSLLEFHPAVRELVDLISGTERQRIKLAILLRQVAASFPEASPHALLKGVLTWGTYAALLGFDRETNEVFVCASAKVCRPKVASSSSQ
jgi:hypothetical protein